MIEIQPRLALGVYEVAFLFAASSPSAAAPITFNFDTQITSTSAGGPFNLPLTYKVGDTIYGRFTFDPEVLTTVYDNGISAIQPFEFVFDINGQVIASSPYEFNLQDNSAIEDTDLGTIDLMILRSLSGADSQPPLISLPGGDAFRVRVTFTLVGDPAAISANAFPTDLTSWNAFGIYKTLSLNFDNPGPGSMGLQGEISSFTLIPELTSFELCYTGLFTVSFLAISKKQLFEPLKNINNLRQ